MAYGVPQTPPVIGAIEADSAAQEAGLRVGDRIVRIDGRTMDNFNDIQGAVAFNLGNPADLEIARGDERLSVTLRPRMISERDPFGNKSERAVIGIRSDAPVYKIGRATSELPSLMRISYAVFCLKKKNK